MSRYVDLILQEARLWAEAQGDGGPSLPARTVFFGGGTPSLLPIDSMRRLIDGLRRQLDLRLVREWTVEANPATVDRDYCAMLRDLGVDRMSFGAQSFSTAELAMLERHHHPDDVPRSIEIARACGIERINIDLIYAIPGQSLESWQSHVERALALGTTHLSCYGLTYEANTPMAVRKRLGQFQGAEETLELAMFHWTRQRLEASGLMAYEISNFSTPGQECQHNLLYWTGASYIGLGPSAASHVHGARWKNRPHLGEWESAIANSALPAIELEHLDPRQRADERVMLGLRLRQGVGFDDFTAHTGFDARALYADQLQRLARLGLLCVNDTGFALTPKGLDVADAVAGEFLD